jgi:hypothetical protein
MHAKSTPIAKIAEAAKPKRIMFAPLDCQAQAKKGSLGVPRKPAQE